MWRFLLLLPILVSCGGSPPSAQDAAPAVASVALPAPQLQGGIPLMQALQRRKSARKYVDSALTQQQLSDLLWAAFGVNRPGTDKRTAPTAYGKNEIDVYLATADALHLYRPGEHALQTVLPEDLRAATGRQDFVGDAAANLVYVADYRRSRAGDRAGGQVEAAVAVGAIVQNVYLYCASEGLASVVRGSIDRGSLRKRMKLAPEQEILMAQTVGHSPGG